MRKGSTAVRLGIVAIASSITAIFLISGMVGCGTAPKKSVWSVALGSSARVTGCLAAQKADNPGDLDAIVNLTKLVAKGDTSEIGNLITQIEALENDNLSKIVALSLRDLLEVYGLPVPSAVLPVSPEVIMAAEKFLEGVKLCEE